MNRRKQPLAGRIIAVFILVIMIVLVPITIFIYSYGQKLTTDNLMDQLSVSMSDNRIRFDNTIEGVKGSLNSIASSNTIRNMLAIPESFSTTAAVSLLGMLGFGYEDEVIFAVISADGTLMAATQEEALEIYTVQLLEGRQWNDGISYGTDTRYRAAGNTVVLNLAREIRSREGELLGYAIADVFGDPFVHFADPALVNAACLYDTSTDMVSSLTYLDVYSRYDDLAPFAGTSKPSGSPYNTRNGGRLISFYELTSMPFYIVGYLDITPYMNSLNQFYTLLFIVIAVVVLVSLCMAVFLSGSIVKPIHVLISAMSSAESGNLKVQVVTSNITEMAELESKFNEMISRINSLIIKNKEESEKVAEAERKALEAQMNPHFLYNTLNVIRSLARMHNETQIERITIKLGKLLRYAVDNHDPMETLENSYQMVESYLDIQKVRFGDKLHTSLHLDESVKEVMVPKLMIQPLVENSIGHGLESKIGDWELEVTIRDEGERVHITVRDNGAGFDASAISDMEVLATSGHTGIYNVYKRMQLCYADKAEFHITSQIGEGTRSDLLFPKDGQK